MGRWNVIKTNFVKRNILTIVTLLVLPFVVVYMSIIFNLLVIFTNYITARVEINLSAEQISNADWFIGHIGVFSGIVAALAIFVSIRQSQNITMQTQKLLTEEKRYDTAKAQNESIIITINSLVTEILKINTEDRIWHIPRSQSCYEQKLLWHKNFYGTTENSYNELFLKRVLFDYCDECINCKQQDKRQKDMLVSRKRFAENYRELYHTLHDYMNFAFDRLKTHYFINNMSAWEMQYRIDTLIAQDARDRSDSFDDTKPWRLVNGIKSNWSSDGQNQFLSNEITHFSELLEHINQKATNILVQEQEYLDKINKGVIDLRACMMDYIQAKEVFDNAVLREDIAVVECGVNHLKTFMLHK